MTNPDKLITARCLFQVALDQVENGIGELEGLQGVTLDEAANAALRATAELEYALKRLHDALN